LGLVHGHLTGNNVFATEEGMIQISDFSLQNLFNDESDEWIETYFYDCSRESFTARADVGAFARLLSDIVFGTSCDGSGQAGGIPSFVLEIIERRDYSDLKTVDPLTYILTFLKRNEFKIVAGVDHGEVSKFLDLIQFSETLPD
jgi:hypothetical protein